MLNIKKPLVSIVMATYNEPKQFIKLSILSILNQTYKNIEFIIIDDSTNSETIKVLDSYAEIDSRIILIRNTNKIGFVKALNIGLNYSKGKYIARMDSDDISLPYRIEDQVNFLETNPKVDVLGGSINIINSESEITSVRKYPTSNFKLVIWMIFRDPVGHPSVMYRSEIIENGNYYDNKMDKGCEDTEFWLRLRNRGYHFANLSYPILNYRIIVDMMTKRKKDRIYNYIARLKNIHPKYIILDFIAIIFLFIRDLIPNKLISYIYEIENKQKY